MCISTCFTAGFCWWSVAQLSVVAGVGSAAGGAISIKNILIAGAAAAASLSCQIHSCWKVRGVQWLWWDRFAVPLCSVCHSQDVTGTWGLSFCSGGSCWWLLPLSSSMLWEQAELSECQTVLTPLQHVTLFNRVWAEGASASSGWFSTVSFHPTEGTPPHLRVGTSPICRVLF